MSSEWRGLGNDKRKVVRGGAKGGGEEKEREIRDEGRKMRKKGQNGLLKSPVNSICTNNIIHVEIICG